MTAAANREVGLDDAGADDGKIPDAKGMPDYVRRKYEQGIDADLDNRTAAMDDQMFAAGFQWTAQAERERIADDRPCLTINRIPQFLRQVTGDVRLNKPAIKVRPAGSKASQDVAEVYTGLIRHIEQVSDADTAYICAFESAVSCGMGFWRITTQYSSDDQFEQDIRIKRIADPFSVIFDPNAKEFDRSDAKWCVVTWMMSREAFKAAYPGKSLTGFEDNSLGIVGASSAWVTDWYLEDAIRVAEFWVKEPTKRTLFLLSDGEVLADEKVTPEIAARYVAEKNAQAMATGAPPVTIKRTREVDTHKVRQYIVSGADLLEEPVDWAGKDIPIIAVVGTEVNLGDKVIRKGMVRDAKDAQRTYNYMRSAAVEVIALQPKAPYIVTPKMVTGQYMDWWLAAGKRNFPFLPYSPDPEAPGQMPQRLAPPSNSTGLMAEGQLAADDMKATTGIYDASLGSKSNETSGRAILARQREGDVGSFHFIDNLTKSIAYCGRQLVDLIPKIYDTERQVRILAENGDENLVTINRTVMDIEGNAVITNDVTAGEYDVVVSAGPSFSTRREEAVATLTELSRASPQIAAIITDLIVANMDMPDGEKVVNRLKKLLPPGIDDEGEQKAPPPDPKVMAEAVKTQTTASRTEAETEGIRLDNVKKALEIDNALGGINAAVAAQVDAAVGQHLARMFGGGMPQGGPMMAPGMGAPPPMNPGAPLPPDAMPDGGFMPPPAPQLTAGEGGSVQLPFAR